ncbi:MAG: hypothetical protein EOM80_10465 [Erysipelotrichia bacterium]|nr:hypothetical protein [Erysipelotrichia bacterium]
MLQVSHRGIYEYLWSEHKYRVIGVSIKAVQNMAARLGRRPQTTSLLKKLAEFEYSEKPEFYNALLNAYMHIKPAISRQRRLEIIETLLKDNASACLLIYEDALRLKEKSLAGCRLFFAPMHAVYKFWDAQDKPGLWLCFGPFQLHLTPQQVFSRIALESGTEATDLYQRLSRLREGISAEEFAAWPGELRTRLFQSNMVATPGEKRAWLHPRIPLDKIEAKATISEVDIYTAAALIVEKIWDRSEYLPETIAQLPDFEIFSDSFVPETLPAIRWQSAYSANEAGDFLANAFWEQHRKESGQKNTEQQDNDSGAGVGVETADEQVDSEEGEHRDDEPCD